VGAGFRWNFWKRWGAAFADMARVDDSVPKMSLGATLPATGIGLRWRMIEAFKINMRVDHGWVKH
jgi:hemolysin activation/secretion protein